MNVSHDTTEPAPATALSCAICGARSAWQQGFVTEPRFLLSSRTICLTCYAYRQRFFLYYLKWLMWTAAIVALGFFVAGSVWSGVVFALGLYALAYLAIVLHELGHFAAARLVGVEVPIMSFGGGLHMKVVKLRDTFLLLSPSPTEGLIIPAFASRDHFKKKDLLISFAGPATNIAMALPGLFILQSAEGQSLPDVLGVGLGLWTAINLLLGVANLFPFSDKTAFGQRSSDGAQILRLLKIPEAEIDKLIRARDLLRASVEFSYGDKERCLALLEKQAAHGQESFHTRILTVAALIDTDRLDPAVERGRAHLEDESPGLMEKAMLQNNVAFALFLRGHPGDLDEADRLSASAHDVLPMILAVKSTRGAVLIARGRFSEGVELLTDKRFRMDTPSNRATVYANRARGLAAMGELASARESMRAAQQLDAGNRLLPSASEAIQAAARAWAT